MLNWLGYGGAVSTESQYPYLYNYITSVNSILVLYLLDIFTILGETMTELIDGVENHPKPRHRDSFGLFFVFRTKKEKSQKKSSVRRIRRISS